ncbi:MAG: HEAT repeat domain-containing protein [Candidatus Eremiobacteraeota bacterium]|nr:HEAT repeat domain-containing protein [Candidatus Eremiobacteraeota bacterium]
MELLCELRRAIARGEVGAVDVLADLACTSPEAAECLVEAIPIGGQNVLKALAELRREYPRHQGVTLRLLAALQAATDAEARLALLEALERHGDETAVPALVDLLEGPEVVEAALALGRVGSARAGSSLAAVLEAEVNRPSSPRLEQLVEAAARLECIEATVALARAALAGSGPAYRYLWQQRKLLAAGLAQPEYRRLVLETYIEFPKLTDPAAVTRLLDSPDGEVSRLAARAMASADWAWH